ncbi:polysaccharide deacetylase family protein [Paenibacillus sp. An7]|uniref:polysaccharide deacetylase family protein n=1 Tax=Paenibacillus sp. An7 TaxID=2689577 RepID=UPI0013571AC8|nr:polysaccharide deacetylase family protein [Paenibacillus sp. An7]
MTKLSIVHKVSTQEKVVAFTFDDGPHPLYTKQVLDIFRDVNGKATFFMIGQEMDAYEEIAREVHAAGHEIANHTFSHPDLTKLKLEEVRTELQQADEKIRHLTGKPVLNFRPPYFSVNEDILALAGEFGYTAIGTVNGGAKDWEQPGVDYILDHTRPTIDHGSILIFHDGYGERAQTIEAVKILVDELHHEGYRFLTVSELLHLTNHS